METLFDQPVWSICYLAVLVGLSAYGLHRYFIIYQFLKHSGKHDAPGEKFSVLPRVTVQLPIFNESNVVARLLKAVSEIDYPRDRLQIQLLDDSTDDTRTLAREAIDRLLLLGFDAEYIHRTDRTGFKAGALENGMATATGEFFFLLDADFVPQPDILHQTIHYFTDPSIGMVQTRWGHLNRHHSLLTRIQAMFLDGHLLLEQTARARSGRFFNFNGTGGLWRRSAIEESGGWQHDTLTEDMDLSYRAQLEGWKFIFLPEVVIPGELPPDMAGFKSQQHRWTKGSIQTCKKLLGRIWKAPIPLALKVEATMHLTSNFGYLLLACLCVLMLPKTFAPDAGPAFQTWMVDVLIFLATTVSIAIFYAVAQRYLNPRGWIRDLCLLPMLLALAVGMSVNNARAVLEAMMNHQSPFIRTPKFGDAKSARLERPRNGLSVKTLLSVIELALVAYFGMCLGQAIASGQWTSIPYLLMFCVGFAYVALQPLHLVPARSYA